MELNDNNLHFEETEPRSGLDALLSRPEFVAPDSPTVAAMFGAAWHEWRLTKDESCNGNFDYDEEDEGRPPYWCGAERDALLIVGMDLDKAAWRVCSSTWWGEPEAREDIRQIVEHLIRHKVFEAGDREGALERITTKLVRALAYEYLMQHDEVETAATAMNIEVPWPPTWMSVVAEFRRNLERVVAFLPQEARVQSYEDHVAGIVRDIEMAEVDEADEERNPRVAEPDAIGIARDIEIAEAAEDIAAMDHWGATTVELTPMEQAVLRAAHGPDVDVTKATVLRDIGDDWYKTYWGSSEDAGHEGTAWSHSLLEYVEVDSPMTPPDFDGCYGTDNDAPLRMNDGFSRIDGPGRIYIHLTEPATYADERELVAYALINIALYDLARRAAA